MGLHWGQSGAFLWCGDQLWGTIISPVLLREHIFSESYILPRWFCLPRDWSGWRKSSDQDECIVRNRIVPGGFVFCALWSGSRGFVFRDCKSSWNRQVKDGRAGTSCPQSSPCASTNKAPPSTDLVWCIRLLTLGGFAFSNSNGVWSCWCLLGLVGKWREDSAEWCYLCHPLQGCPGSCTTEKAHGAPVSSSSLFKSALQSKAGNFLSLPRTIQTGICMWEAIVICSP